ncbi:MAG: OmpH family outer membrane protein [Alcaligenaceae bacterium]|nr:OmpH family outer membrane protein [Alcaligenaceae bacterium]
MRKIGVLLATSVLGLSLSVPTAFAQATKATDAAEKKTEAAADNAPLKIGFVNTEKILRDSAPAKEAQQKIETEFKKRDEELQKLATTLRSKAEEFDKNAPVMTDADRSKAQRELSDLDTDLQRKRREFQEDFNRRRNEAFSGIVDKANVAIREIAEKESYDLIVQDAVTVSARIDITEAVIQVLDKK